MPGLREKQAANDQDQPGIMFDPGMYPLITQASTLTYPRAAGPGTSRCAAVADRGGAGGGGRVAEEDNGEDSVGYMRECKNSRHELSHT